VSHLGRGLDYLDVVEAHWRAAADEPEMPADVLADVLRDLHRIEMTIAYYAAKHDLERSQRPPGGTE
jgi:hypothetical protein